MEGNPTKKVLIVLYYWPPSGGGGVQRWLKFARYLPQFGWEPIIFAPENADYPLTDPSLEEDIPEGLTVIKSPIWEPYSLYSKFMGARTSRNEVDQMVQAGDKQGSWKKDLAMWVRGNFFIPDARTFWVKPSVRRIVNYLQDNPVDVIVTTGPPHSMHLIGKGVKEKTGIPWVADFRDPWSKIEFFDNLKLSPGARKKHLILERETLKKSDATVTVGWIWGKQFEGLGAERVEVITNGYDEADFEAVEVPLSQKFRLSHLGTFGADRDPVTLWKTLQKLCDEIPGFREDLEIELVGNTDPAVFASLEAHGLKDVTTYEHYVPHAEAIRKMKAAQVLLLLINNVQANSPGRATGKIYEYLSSRRPVLCVGPPEGDADKILSMTGAGVVCDFEDLEKTVETIRDFYTRFKNGNLMVDNQNIEQFSRQNLAKKLSVVLDSVSENP